MKLKMSLAICEVDGAAVIYGEVEGHFSKNKFLYISAGNIFSILVLNN